MILANTCFKPINKTATWRTIGLEINAETNKDTHEQIDFIASQHRWKNSIIDIEATQKQT